MSRRTPTKSKIKVCNKSVFHLQDKKADENELTIGLIKSAKRTGQLSLCNRGLGTVPENVWKINELVLEETKEVDFARSDQSNWWNCEPLKMLDLSSNVIKKLSPNLKFLQELVTLKTALHDGYTGALCNVIFIHV
ncbi:jg15194 [Pararge aegeria aegeria]|uniref:Jg15194 protein n=1 Tax=Pararge aegeria aegeria TaxID=348720 RepID=A0A8S4QI26_9NEOP|nr:jg15194 [Pararge aegeria aegeria]